LKRIVSNNAHNYTHAQKKDAEHKQQEEKRKQDEATHKTAEEHTHTATALHQLAAMGFSDATTNISLLQQFHHNINDVVTQLTQSIPQSIPSDGDSRGGSRGGSEAAITSGWKVPASALEWKHKLGNGSYGSVYEVKWGGVLIAAKKMSFTVEGERQATERMLLREFRALQQLQHPHIVRMYGVVVEDLVLLMELSHLGSLRHLLTTAPALVLNSQPAQFSLLIGIASGMAFLHHQNILHHDLKSDNVLVWEDGSKFIAKIADLGLATGTLASTMKTAKSGTGAATLAYKAPEAFDDEFSMESEVYAYSIVGWEVLTGKVPWEGYSEARLTKAIIKEERQTLLPDVAAAPLGQMVQRCWAQEPKQRPSFAALVTQLEAATKQFSGSSGHKVHVTLPPTWSPVTQNEQLAQKVLVDVGAERNKVVEAFMRTLDGRGIQVVDVHRMQNPEMWKMYALKRQSILEREAGADDAKVLLRFERRWLFHGTDKDTCPKIMQQGFNRSFCGKNMTKYGKGVYFARDSSYSSSTTYATPDTQGVQCMFLCCVIVGEYCKGVRDATVPAARHGNCLFDTTVDDMANPSIYVTYNDAQAYPEYLVRFRQ